MTAVEHMRRLEEAAKANNADALESAMLAALDDKDVLHTECGDLVRLFVALLEKIEGRGSV